jgi:hypothetical protein
LGYWDQRCTIITTMIEGKHFGMREVNMRLTHVPVAHNKVDYGQYDKTMETDWIAAACMLVNLI